MHRGGRHGRIVRRQTLAGALLACALVGVSPCLFAQTAMTPLAFATAIDTHYNHLHSLRVDFVQTYAGMGMERTERGVLLLAKGGHLHAGKMRWTYTQPAGKLFVFDGSHAYFYTPGQTEVQRVPAKQLNDLRSPLALLLGHADLAHQLRDATLTQDANGDETLRGTPQGLEQRVRSLSVTANAEGVIHSMTIEQTDGATNEFTFSHEQPNVPVPASAFTFTPPPGTHIVEGEAPI